MITRVVGFVASLKPNQMEVTVVLIAAANFAATGSMMMMMTFHSEENGKMEVDEGIIVCSPLR